jgi:hypothetical protein
MSPLRPADDAPDRTDTNPLVQPSADATLVLPLEDETLVPLMTLIAPPSLSVLSPAIIFTAVPC